MGIYQRDLTGYEETPIAENRNFGRAVHQLPYVQSKLSGNHDGTCAGKSGGTLICKNGKGGKG
ncbi:hypothetical protein NXY49_00070 [Bacteroides fragilis]|nr:hypothetical protein [Bacteroides fragilis]